MGPGSGGWGLRPGVFAYFIQELDQMSMDRFDGFLQYKKHDYRKGQLAVPSKIFGPHSMASDELAIMQCITQGLDQHNQISGNGLKKGW
jgi:hypothetical protein